MKRNINKRLVIVSNRLPFTIDYNGGGWNLNPSSGGLVTALTPVMRKRGGLWIGWPGVSEATNLAEILASWSNTAGYEVQPVMLTTEEHEKYYYGFSNEIIWPLFHDLQSLCNFFNTDYWHHYQQVNQKFAQVIAQHTTKNNYIWVQDYHLMNVAKEARAIGVESSMGLFIHTPFPPVDMFLKLPWREQIIEALLEYDMIGLQTLHDRNNFLQCVETIMAEVKISGRGRVVTISNGERETRVGHFPIGIDYKEFAHPAATNEVAERARSLCQDVPNRQFVFGVDRLDYTKGISCKLEAYRNVLQRFPELHQKITLIQVIVPSRESIPKYHEMKTEVERLISEINGQFTKSGWVPIHYIFRSLSRTELIAYYRAAKIALVTPLKDGMNLVAKEYCAASVTEDGVLILSEFAGAAAQLENGALLVNPYNVAGVADAIYQAFTMTKSEQRTRMRKLRRSVRNHDVFWWVDTFLQTSSNKNMDDLPLTKEPLFRDSIEQIGRPAHLISNTLSL